MQRLRAVLVGAGRMGLGYADDPIMARHYRYAAHAQVLAVHDRFEWVATVDPSEEARAAARDRWGVSLAVASVADLPADLRPDVAVIATAPNARRTVLDGLPSLRAVLVEKPLGASLRDAEAFVAECQRRRLLVQVNLWRRADQLSRRLAGGLLGEKIGAVQAAFGVYGNGLLNNGTHMVDYVRMLAGEIVDAHVVPGGGVRPCGPIAGDVLVPFSLQLATGATALFQPVDFKRYRENGLDLWGDRGRLSILQEGLLVQQFPVTDNRAMKEEKEIASDRPETLEATVGDALFAMYSNLADAVAAGAPLVSPADSALATTRIVDTLHAEALAAMRSDRA